MNKNRPQFLLDNETLKIEMVRSVAALVLRAIGSIMLFAILLVGSNIVINFVFQKGGPNSTLPYVIGAAVVCFIIALLRFLPLMFHYLTDYACITEQRVYGKIGMLHTVELDVPLDKIQSVSVNQGMMGKLFNYATIRISAVNDGWRFRIVKNYDEFRKMFYTQKEIMEKGGVGAIKAEGDGTQAGV